MKRMKKLLIGLLACVSVLAGSFGLAACDLTIKRPSNSNSSSAEESSDSNISSEEENGSDNESSSAGENDSDGENGSNDGNNSNDENNSDGENGSNDGNGSNEGQTPVFSEGLEYTLLENDTYEVSGKGDCADINIVIPSCYNDKVVSSIGECAFQDCESLTSIEIPDSVTSIGNYAFDNCTALTEIHYNATECADLSLENYVFSYAGKNGDGITVMIGANVKKIPAYLFYPYSSSCAPKITRVAFEEDSVCETIGESAFSGCQSLINVEIPDSVISIGERAFFGCQSLTSIEIPDSVTSMGEYTFAQCNNLINVKIGNRVTSIGTQAFYNCTSLQSVEIPDCVTSIGFYAFFNCRSLTSITFNGTVEEWNAMEKGRSWETGVSATKVVCSDGEVAL